MTATVTNKKLNKSRAFNVRRITIPKEIEPEAKIDFSNKLTEAVIAKKSGK